MKDKISVNIGTDHSYDCKTDVIGRAGEGNVTQMEFKIPSKLCSCSLYLDFEKPNGETYRTPKIEIVDGVATYNVQPFVLTDSGEIKVQAVFEKASGEIWKSEIKMYANRKSINVSEDIEGFVMPIGSLTILDNGTYDVTLFKSAVVAVDKSTGDATATAGDVVYGTTFYGKDGKTGGAMQRATTSRFKNIVIEKSAEKTVAISYYANENLYIPNTVGSTRMGEIASVTDEAFIASNIKKGVTLFGLVGEYVSEENSPLPIEVKNEIEMDDLLWNTNIPVGSVYKYTGTSGKYENGALYVIAEE